MLSLAVVPVFFGSLYFAARSGVDIADKQVPPGSVRVAGEVGGYWHSRSGGGKLVVADTVQALREYAFRQSVVDSGRADGVREIELAAEGWEIEVLSGGDRRFLRVRLAADGREGEVFWMRAKDLRAVAKPAGG